MTALIGFVIVIGAILGGYMMEGGHLAVLFQPAELVIIGGSAVGAVIIGNPIRTIKGLIGGVLGVLKGDHYTKKTYLQTLKMLHDLFAAARKEGAARLEAHIENPAESTILKEYPFFLKDHAACSFFCDSVRVVLMGGVSTHELERAMEIDEETHHQAASEPVSALQSMADALPGLGIVAAVLGIVITMGALGGPATEIGHKVAAALVGTFLGVLLCYGFIGPISTRMAKGTEAEAQYLVCLRNALLAYVRGCGPLLAAEFGRRSVPPHLRPTFQEFEGTCKGGGQAAEKAAA